MEVLNIKDLKSGVILFGHTVKYISFFTISTESVQFLESADVVKTCETMQISFKSVCKIGCWEKEFFWHWPEIHKNVNLQNGEKLSKL